MEDVDWIVSLSRKSVLIACCKQFPKHCKHGINEKSGCCHTREGGLLAWSADKVTPREPSSPLDNAVTSRQCCYLVWRKHCWSFLVYWMNRSGLMSPDTQCHANYFPKSSISIELHAACNGRFNYMCSAYNCHLPVDTRRSSRLWPDRWFIITLCWLFSPLWYSKLWSTRLAQAAALSHKYWSRPAGGCYASCRALTISHSVPKPHSVHTWVCVYRRDFSPTVHHFRWIVSCRHLGQLWCEILAINASAKGWREPIFFAPPSLDWCGRGGNNGEWLG